MPENPLIPFEPHRFQSTVEYYVRGRLPYPERLIELVVARTGLTGEDLVLDLGCGPGFLAAVFAPHAREVIGMDPEPAMLEAAEAYAREKQSRVSYRLGSSYDLEKVAERFRLVTMGRSFHWMDRAATLEALDRIVVDGGAVALFGDSHLKLPQNRWHDEFQAVLEPFAHRDSNHFVRKRREGSWTPHEAFLLDSKFNHLERVSVVQRIETPVERLIDRALSQSPTSPERLGAELDAVVAKLHDVLAPHAKGGVIEEIVESEALLAFR